jgi:hypothetical protein
MRPRVPDRIEEHEHRADVVPRGDVQEHVNALPKAGRVLLPEQVVQEDPHGVHA